MTFSRNGFISDWIAHALLIIVIGGWCPFCESYNSKKHNAFFHPPPFCNDHKQIGFCTKMIHNLIKRLHIRVHMPPKVQSNVAALRKKHCLALTAHTQSFALHGANTCPITDQFYPNICNPKYHLNCKWQVCDLSNHPEWRNHAINHYFGISVSYFLCVFYSPNTILKSCWSWCPVTWQWCITPFGFTWNSGLLWSHSCEQCQRCGRPGCSLR